jgi:hypothetical protein
MSLAAEIVSIGGRLAGSNFCGAAADAAAGAFASALSC